MAERLYGYLKYVLFVAFAALGAYFYFFAGEDSALSSGDRLFAFALCLLLGLSVLVGLSAIEKAKAEALDEQKASPEELSMHDQGL